MSPIIIRKAKIRDVVEIHRLINHYAEKRLLLPRSLSELYERLRDFFVLVASPSQHAEASSGDLSTDEYICGVCGLGICWDDLAEIRSLAVWESYRDKGFGSRLVDECLSEARQLGLKKVFTLTYAPYFFEKLGFIRVDKSSLPQKIWGDCLRCPQFPNCDEIALVLDLHETASIENKTDNIQFPKEGRTACSA
jgi:amino-acid N-acetyltransferase